MHDTYTYVFCNLYVYKMKRNLTPKEIGISLKGYFVKKGMSQSQVADRFLVAHSWIGRIYAGKFTEISDVITAMCREAKIPLEGVETFDENELYAAKLATLLSEIWSGTPEDARFLIDALSVLRQFRSGKTL